MRCKINYNVISTYLCGKIRGHKFVVPVETLCRPLFSEAHDLAKEVNVIIPIRESPTP